MHRATLLSADGGGPEAGEIIRTVKAAGVQIDWDVQEIPPIPAEAGAGPLPRRVLDSIRDRRVALSGILALERCADLSPLESILRKELDLFANLRRAKSHPSRPGLHRNVDLVIIQETSEDQFTTVEFDVGTAAVQSIRSAIAGLGRPSIRDDAVVAVRAMSDSGSRRLARFGFDYARANSRKKITAVHKANIIKAVDGLFLRAMRDVASDYADIEFEDRIIDNMCMQLVKRPHDYDVLVAPNLYGDLLVGLAAGLVGGPDVAASASFGDGVAIFQAKSWTAGKDSDGDGTSLRGVVLAAAMLLRHLGDAEAGDRLERASAG